MIKAVVFDLDDTLCPEIEYVKSGFRAIANAFGDEQLYEKLYNLFQDDKANVYQRAGFGYEQCKKCIDIYRNHIPDINLKQDVIDTLKTLKYYGYKLGIITDGRPEGQRNKINALGLDKCMDYIIITDELGGIKYRKPNPKAFEIMRKVFNVEFDEMVYVGDNPEKDFFIGSIYPIMTIRVMSKGIYDSGDYLDSVKESFRVNSIAEIKEYIDDRCTYYKS